MSVAWRVFALAALVIATGCGGGTITDIGDADKPGPHVLFFNVSPDAGPLDFYLDDVRYAASVAYVTGLTGVQQFIDVPFLDDENGTYDIGARPEGGGEDTELDLTAQALARDANTFVTAFGKVTIDETDPSDNDKIFQILVINLTLTRPNGNKARIIAFNGFMRSQSNINVNMSIQTPGDNPQFKVTDVPFGTFKEALVDSGTFTYQLRRADVDDSVIYAEKVVDLAPGGTYVVFMSGIEKANPNDPPAATDPALSFVEIPSRTDQ